MPLALFGPHGYARLMGRLRDALVAQVLAPAVAALLVDSVGARGTFAVLAAFGCANVALVAALALLTRSRA